MSNANANANGTSSIKIVAKGDMIEAYKDGKLVEAWREDDMSPLDQGSSLIDLVRMALYNIDRMGAVSHVRASAWLQTQDPSVRSLAKARPPNKLYRIKGGLRGTQHGFSPLGVIVSYKPAERGEPAYALCLFLGIKSGPGSMEAPGKVPAEGLEDITEAARRDVTRPAHARELLELCDKMAD